MANCKECGAYISDGFEQCPACGKSVKEKKERKTDAWDIYKDNNMGSSSRAQKQTDNSGQYKQTERKYDAGYNQKRASKEEFRADEWRQSSYDGENSNRTVFNGEVIRDTTMEQRILGACSYLSWLFLLPFFARREDPYVKFHLNQGIVLFLGNLIKWFSGGFGWLIGLGMFVLGVMGLINALSGKEKPLPLIGGINIIK